MKYSYFYHCDALFVFSVLFYKNNADPNPVNWFLVSWITMLINGLQIAFWKYSYRSIWCLESIYRSVSSTSRITAKWEPLVWERLEKQLLNTSYIHSFGPGTILILYSLPHCSQSSYFTWGNWGSDRQVTHLRSYKGICTMSLCLPSNIAVYMGNLEEN